MRLPLKTVPVLFLIGVAGGLLGDAGHVQSGTTVYLKTGVPFIWESAFWFAAMVGAATVAAAELRLWIAPARPDASISDGVGAIGVMVGIYAITALVRDEPLLPSTVIVYMLAAIAWHVSGDGWPGAICGLAAAIVGTATEIVMVQAGIFEYAAEIDGLWGVAPWLPALYFAFGVVAARLGEISARFSPDATG